MRVRSECVSQAEGEGEGSGVPSVAEGGVVSTEEVGEVATGFYGQFHSGGDVCALFKRALRCGFFIAKHVIASD